MVSEETRRSLRNLNWIVASIGLDGLVNQRRVYHDPSPIKNVPDNGIESNVPTQIETEPVPSAQERLKVLYVNDSKNFMVCRWRTHWPLKYIGEKGVEARTRELIDGGLINMDAESAFERIRADVEWADVVVFQRTIIHTPQMISKARAMGKIIGYDIDDLVFGYDPAEINAPRCHHEFIRTNMPVYNGLLGKVDFVTTTTEELEEGVRRYNSNVSIVRNGLDFEALDRVVQPKQNYTSRGKLRIGWVGSTSHAEDLLSIVDVIKSANEKYKGRLTFVFKVGIPEVTDTLKRECPGIDIETHGYSPEADWAQYYKDVQDLNLDIMVSPLIQCRFNEAKSELKYLESSLYGLPLVSSNVGGVRAAIRNRNNGYLANNNYKFFRYLTNLIENPSERERIGRNARADIEGRYNLHVSVDSLYSALQSNLNRQRRLAA